MIRKLIENRYIIEKLPEALEKIAPVLLYPLFGILIIGLLMNFVIEPVMGAINGAMNSGLMSMSGSSRSIIYGIPVYIDGTACRNLRISGSW